MTIPIFDAAPEEVPPDEHSRRIREGVKADRVIVDRRVLDAQVRQLAESLPPSLKPKAARRERAGLRTLTPEEERYVSPRVHTAAGARNSAADLALIQKAHNALSALGAVCREGSAADEETPNPGNVLPADEQSSFSGARTPHDHEEFFDGEPARALPGRIW